MEGLRRLTEHKLQGYTDSIQYISQFTLKVEGVHVSGGAVVKVKAEQLEMLSLLHKSPYYGTFLWHILIFS